MKEKEIRKNSATKKKLEEIFDNNDNYIHGYTGTPMLDAEKVIPIILKLFKEKDDQITALRKEVKYYRGTN